MMIAQPSPASHPVPHLWDQVDCFWACVTGPEALLPEESWSPLAAEAVVQLRACTRGRWSWRLG